jgi:hypothetical protein
MSYDSSTYRLTESEKPGVWALIIGIAGLVLSALGLMTDKSQFFHSYLVAFLFWTSIALGALFFTMLNHLTNARWSIVLRRITESLMMVIPLLAVFFIPLIFGLHDLYHWTHAEEVAHDPILQEKSGYLNTGFFIARTVIYFIIWTLLARTLYRISLKQDIEAKESYIKRMRNLSAPGLLLFALTITFAAFDWLMSLNPHWYSTIFGLYFFAGCFLALLGFMVTFGNAMRSKGILSETISVDHYHDLAKLLFGFTIFWGYMGFSQYFLIWYANIPEETIWFLNRWEGSWKYITLVIVFGHFAVPFLGLLIRAAKRNLAWLTFISVWILIMHWIDLYWMVFPTHSPGTIQFSWMDLTLFIGVGGVFFWFFWRQFVKNPLVPVNDHRLSFSLEFKNQ